MDFFRTYSPRKELQDIVELYWRSYSDLDQSLIQEMYTPTLQALTFNLGGRHEDIVMDKKRIRMDKHCYIIGQPLSKRVSLSNPKGIDILGVKFTPLGLYLLTGIDMKHISDKIIDAGDIWNNEISLLYEEILSKEIIQDQVDVVERFLLKKRMEHNCCEKILMLHHTLNLMGNKKIFTLSEIREDSFITKKTLERYFVNHIGVTPKQYANICRFNNVLTYLDDLLTEPDWYDVIVSFGYYDQSHLIREFKRYSGKTPKEHFLQKPRIDAPENEVNLKQIFV